MVGNLVISTYSLTTQRVVIAACRWSVYECRCPHVCVLSIIPDLTKRWDGHVMNIIDRRRNVTIIKLEVRGVAYKMYILHTNYVHAHTYLVKLLYKYPQSQQPDTCNVVCQCLMATNLLTLQNTPQTDIIFSISKINDLR